jgi:hypothetical protein
MALGRTYVEIQDLDDGQKEFQEILKIRESEKKLTALDATESMNELGKIYRAKGQFSPSSETIQSRSGNQTKLHRGRSRSRS